MSSSLLAPHSGSIRQFVLASLPLLAVLLYMLYAAYKRPNEPFYNIPEGIQDDEVYQSYVDNSPSMFPLYDITMVFLSFFVLWTTLLVYIVMFVPKRRRLMELYLQEPSSVLGNVFPVSFRCCPRRFSTYAYITYRHPYKTDGSKIEKQVRIYQHFTRENVSILYLPDKPFSGQPATDVEIDVAASTDSRDKTRKLVRLILAWMLFCLLSPLYVLHQMSLIEDRDDYERTSRGWRSYWIMVAVVTPVVAMGGNYLRFALHRYWLLYRGYVLVSGEESIYTDNSVPRSSQKSSVRTGNVVDASGTVDLSSYTHETQTDYEALSEKQTGQSYTA